MNLSQFLATQEIILLDGAMGTQLDQAGLEMGGWNNLTHPQAVRDIHKAYAASGSDILMTNTITMNRLFIESHQLGIDVQAVNAAGAALAREVAGNGRYVLGNIGSTGKLLEPYGEIKTGDACGVFEEQAAALLQGGVDGFVIETMIDLNEALCALQACKKVCSLPVLVSLAYATPQKGGRTIMGNGARESAEALAEAGASAIGANCGDIDPLEMSQIISILKEATSLPVMAQPNAGKPKLIGNQTVFDLTPEDFSMGIAKCMVAGAGILGGCCGTTPDHIRAVADSIKTLK